MRLITLLNLLLDAKVVLTPIPNGLDGTSRPTITVKLTVAVLVPVKSTKVEEGLIIGRGPV